MLPQLTTLPDVPYVLPKRPTMPAAPVPVGRREGVVVPRVGRGHRILAVVLVVLVSAATLAARLLG